LFSAVPYNWELGTMMPRCGSVSPELPSCLMYDPGHSIATGNDEPISHSSHHHHHHQRQPYSYVHNNNNNNNDSTATSIDHKSDQNPHYVSPNLPIHPRSECCTIRTPMPMLHPLERTDSIEIDRPTDPTTPILVPLGASFMSDEPDFVVMIELPSLSLSSMPAMSRSPTSIMIEEDVEGEGEGEGDVGMWAYVGNGFEM
jgi:hypothetical protein